MNAKSFLFVAAWMKPLKTLPAEQRWNVMEAITEYATTGQMTKELDLMETIAFAFIRNEIDRMKAHSEEQSKTRRESATKRCKKDQQTTNQPEIPTTNAANATNDANDANACKEKQEDAPFISESESVSESKSKKSTSTTCTRVRRIADKDAPYHESELLPSFFDSLNQAKLEALAIKHSTPIVTLKTMAEEITRHWALTDKKHENYYGVTSHLIFTLANKVPSAHCLRSA